MFDYEYWGNETFPSHTNMALEEFFLRHSAKGKATLRFFDFPKDSIVLGYAQATDVIKQKDNTFDLNRRISGGSHVQVGPNILAYSFTVPRDGSFTHFEDMRTWFSEHLVNSLGDIGIHNAVADNKASIISLNNKVIAANAMVWGVQSALIHGLIFINPYDADKIMSRVTLQNRKIGTKTYSEYAAIKNLPAVSKLLENIAPNASEDVRNMALKDLVAKAIINRVTKNKHENKKIDSKIVNDADILLKRKYNLPIWVDKHNPAFTKEELEEIPGEELDGPLKRNLPYCLFIQVQDKDFKKMSETVE